MYSLVHATVTDFNSWKANFDTFDQARQDKGVTSTEVYRSADNPNEAFIILGWSDEEKAKSYHGSDFFKEALERSGVVGSPDISYVEKV